LWSSLISFRAGTVDQQMMLRSFPNEVRWRTWLTRRGTATRTVHLRPSEGSRHSGVSLELW
jgi:hypothetical protein